MMRFLLPALLIFILSGCTKPGPLAEDAGFKAIPASGWVYGDTLTFRPDSLFADSGATAGIAIAVRHTDAYLYSNLWLELTSTAADSLRRDTVNIPLADTYGKWYGKGMGVSFVTVDTLPMRLRADTANAVTLRHIMRVDTLRDIEQVGIIFFDASTR